MGHTEERRLCSTQQSQVTDSLTHSLTHSPTRPMTHALTHSEPTNQPTIFGQTHNRPCGSRQARTHARPTDRQKRNTGGGGGGRVSRTRVLYSHAAVVFKDLSRLQDGRVAHHTGGSPRHFLRVTVRICEDQVPADELSLERTNERFRLFRCGGVISVQFRSGQVRSGQVRSGQVRSGQCTDAQTHKRTCGQQMYPHALSLIHCFT